MTIDHERMGVGSQIVVTANRGVRWGVSKGVVRRAQAARPEMTIHPNLPKHHQKTPFLASSLLPVMMNKIVYKFLFPIFPILP
jgi:type II secretory pathway component PulK